MTQPGLVSITFRQLAPEDIVSLCGEAGLAAVEWGGDVHVPHGELETARSVAGLTREAGLGIPAYGSYYRTVESEAEGLRFETVLATAQALGAPAIRVWAGQKGSADASDEYRQAVAKNLRRACQMAVDAGVGISLEFHGKTLTDSIDSTLRLIECVDHPNLKTLWQPSIEMPYERQMEALRAVKPWLHYFHVFSWAKDDDGKRIRHPLAQGEEPWKTFFAEAQPPYALLEFVKGNEPEQLLADAATLKSWLG